MEINELLEKHGVTTVEALEAKLKTSGKTEAETSFATERDGLKKQITDLEGIKASQGDEIGTLRKDLDGLKEKIGKGANNAPADDGPRHTKTEIDWAAENAKREKSMTDEDWEKLDVALAKAEPAVRKLAMSTEEGRAGFMAAILGEQAQGQETFRRPAKQEQLSVAEQIAIGLGKAEGRTTPARRPAGSGHSPNNPTPQTKKPVYFDPGMTSGSLADRLSMVKGE